MTKIHKRQKWVVYDEIIVTIWARKLNKEETRTFNNNNFHCDVRDTIEEWLIDNGLNKKVRVDV